MAFHAIMHTLGHLLLGNFVCTSVVGVGCRDGVKCIAHVGLATTQVDNAIIKLKKYLGKRHSGGGRRLALPSIAQLPCTLTITFCYN